MDGSEQEPKVRVGRDFEREWPGSSALATECLINLGFVYDRLDARIRSLARRHGIPSPGAMNVLEILHGAGEPLPPSVIAERMVISRGTTTELLDTLERRGLIRRSPHGEDRRMRVVELTPEGLTRLQSLLPELHRLEKRWMEALTDSHKRELLRLLAALQAHLSEQ